MATPNPLKDAKDKAKSAKAKISTVKAKLQGGGEKTGIQMPLPVDRTWVRQSFMLAGFNMSEAAKSWRIYTSASQKYTSSRIGCNIPINSPPQRTRYADIRHPGRFHSATTVGGLEHQRTFPKDSTSKVAALGMGRWYSEAIDDNNQLIHMRFGVPEYQGMVSFFTSFYDGAAGLLANEGRGSALLFKAGQIAGFVVTLPFWHFLLVGRVAKFLLTGGIPSKYYYMRPTMSLYWNRVNFIVNMLGVNLGVIPRAWDSPYDAKGTKGTAPDSSEAELEAARKTLNKLAPDLFRESGGIDVYALANKAQRLAGKRYEDIQRMTEGPSTYEEMQQAIKSIFFKPELPPNPGQGYVTAEAYTQDYFSKPSNKDLFSRLSSSENSVASDVAAKAAENTAAATTQTTGDTGTNLPPVAMSANETPAAPAAENPKDGSMSDAEIAAQTGTAEAGARGKWVKSTDTDGKSTWKHIAGWFFTDKGVDMLEAEVRDGSQYVSFRVDFTGTVQESFSNAFGESGISSNLNGIAGSGRESRFNFSGGQIGNGVVDTIVGGIKDIASGALSGLHLSGLIALSGAAYVDIPEVYKSSSSQMPTSSYTIQLRPWSGNLMSRYLYMYIPIAMILAAGLAISTGPQSYTAPFLCELWSRGRNQIRLGMIDSISITRGEGNMGWNNNCEALGIDITFGIKDLSTVMHAPIDGGTMKDLNPARLLMADDSPFNDYLAVLGNLSIADQTMFLRKMALNFAKYGVTLNTFFSRSHAANAFGSSPPGRFLSNFSKDAERLSGN